MPTHAQDCFIQLSQETLVTASSHIWDIISQDQGEYSEKVFKPSQWHHIFNSLWLDKNETLLGNAVISIYAETYKDMMSLNSQKLG